MRRKAVPFLPQACRQIYLAIERPKPALPQRHVKAELGSLRLPPLQAVGLWSKVHASRFERMVVVMVVPVALHQLIGIAADDEENLFRGDMMVKISTSCSSVPPHFGRVAPWTPSFPKTMGCSRRQYFFVLSRKNWKRNACFRETSAELCFWARASLWSGIGGEDMTDVGAAALFHTVSTYTQRFVYRLHRERVDTFFLTLKTGPP